MSLASIQAAAPAAAAVAVELRHTLHRHPEIGLNLVETARSVQEALREAGCDAIQTGIGGTGIVAVIEGSRPGTHAIGLRADMDALPLVEMTGEPWSSEIAGAMHACGHDGHTAWLVAVARILAQTRDFAGRVVLIFQPGEEGFAGAREMMRDGLFTRFPVDEVYAAHGGTEIPVGEFGASCGPMMAAADWVDIDVHGLGCHGARPHMGRDPVVAASALVMQAQTISSRSANPMHPVILSFGCIQGGDPNGVSVIPDSVHLGGTARCMSAEDRDMIERRLAEICEGVSRLYDVNAVLDYRRMYPALVNHEPQRQAVFGVLREFLPEGAIHTDYPASLGAEDFAFMLEEKPGAYVRVGMRDETHTYPVHNPHFDFNDRSIEPAAVFLARLAEARLAALEGGAA